MVNKIMTPKEKAEELVDKYIYKQVMCYGSADFDLMKYFALIAVEEVIKSLEVVPNIELREVSIRWWQEVKQEIEHL